MTAGPDTTRHRRAARPSGARRPLLPALACLLGLAVLLSASADSKDEYYIKSGFLYNFAHYTTWPEGTFEDAGKDKDPIVFAVVGTYPFKDYLDDVAKEFKVSGRKIVVRRFKDLDALDDCHVLFVGRSMEKHTKALFKALEKKPVFTVSDLHGFARDGGVARFVVESGKVKFEINIDAAKRARLSISSQLLKLATILEDED